MFHLLDNVQIRIICMYVPEFLHVACWVRSTTICTLWHVSFATSCRWVSLMANTECVPNTMTAWSGKNQPCDFHKPHMNARYLATYQAHLVMLESLCEHAIWSSQLRNGLMGDRCHYVYAQVIVADFVRKSQTGCTIHSYDLLVSKACYWHTSQNLYTSCS